MDTLRSTRSTSLQCRHHQTARAVRAIFAHIFVDTAARIDDTRPQRQEARAACMHLHVLAAIDTPYTARERSGGWMGESMTSDELSLCSRPPILHTTAPRAQTGCSIRSTGSVRWRHPCDPRSFPPVSCNGCGLRLGNKDVAPSHAARPCGAGGEGAARATLSSTAAPSISSDYGKHTLTDQHSLRACDSVPNGWSESVYVEAMHEDGARQVS